MLTRSRVQNHRGIALSWSKQSYVVVNSFADLASPTDRLTDSRVEGDTPGTIQWPLKLSMNITLTECTGAMSPQLYGTTPRMISLLHPHTLTPPPPHSHPSPSTPSPLPLHTLTPPPPHPHPSPSTPSPLPSTPSPGPLFRT